MLVGVSNNKHYQCVLFDNEKVMNMYKCYILGCYDLQHTARVTIVQDINDSLNVSSPKSKSQDPIFFLRSGERGGESLNFESRVSS